MTIKDLHEKLISKLSTLVTFSDVIDLYNDTLLCDAETIHFGSKVDIGGVVLSITCLDEESNYPTYSIQTVRRDSEDIEYFEYLIIEGEIALDKDFYTEDDLDNAYETANEIILATIDEES